jgi:hypothetical protein
LADKKNKIKQGAKDRRQKRKKHNNQLESKAKHGRPGPTQWKIPSTRHTFSQPGEDRSLQIA